jgi:hypothetical protein
VRTPADELEDELKPRVERKPKIRMMSRERAKLELYAILKEEKFEELRNVHIIELHAQCYERVYKERLAEFDGREGTKTRRQAVIICDRVVKRHLNGDLSQAAELVRWAWSRQKGVEDWAEREHRDINTLSWRKIFSTQMVTEFKIRGRRKLNGSNGSSSH